VHFSISIHPYLFYPNFAKSAVQDGYWVALGISPRIFIDSYNGCPSSLHCFLLHLLVLYTAPRPTLPSHCLRGKYAVCPTYYRLTLSGPSSTLGRLSSKQYSLLIYREIGWEDNQMRPAQRLLLYP
jgi:hypothetical protein